MLSEDACICSENNDIVKYYYNSEQFIYTLIYIYLCDGKAEISEPVICLQKLGFPGFFKEQKVQKNSIYLKDNFW